MLLPARRPLASFVVTVMVSLPSAIIDRVLSPHLCRGSRTQPIAVAAIKFALPVPMLSSISL